MSNHKQQSASSKGAHLSQFDLLTLEVILRNDCRNDLHMGDPNGNPQTSPQHADLHGFLVRFFFFNFYGTKSMWIDLLWAGLEVAMWITYVGGGRFCHGLLEKSLRISRMEGSQVC